MYVHKFMQLFHICNQDLFYLTEVNRNEHFGEVSSDTSSETPQKEKLIKYFVPNDPSKMWYLLSDGASEVITVRNSLQ